MTDKESVRPDAADESSPDEERAGDAQAPVPAAPDAAERGAAALMPEHAPDPASDGPSGVTSKTPSPDETPPERSAPRRRGWLGRLGIVLVFLIAVSGLTLSGWLYYRYEYAGGISGLETRLGELTAAQTALGRDTEALAAGQDDLKQEVAGFQAEVDAAADSAVRALNDALQQVPPTEQRWKLAEVEYLLRVANHRVLLEGDADTALSLLTVADGILEQLDDFALHGVRARLADEILALKSVKRPDMQGLYLRLEAVKAAISDTPLHLPEYLVSDPKAPAEDETLLDTLSRNVGRYFRTRTFEGRNTPLITPEESVYLELNLRLMLERAQLAALRGNQLVYEDSLSSVVEWLREFMDPEAGSVRALIEEIESLQTVRLDTPLPDISGSLNALLERGA